MASCAVWETIDPNKLRFGEKLFPDNLVKYSQIENVPSCDVVNDSYGGVSRGLFRPWKESRSPFPLLTRECR